MNRSIYILMLVLLSFYSKGQIFYLDSNSKSIKLVSKALVFRDKASNLNINQVLKRNLPFRHRTHLNIGISYTDYRLKFALENKQNVSQTFYLAFKSIVNDSLILYKVVNNQVAETKILGENLPFSRQEVKHRTPIFKIKLDAKENALFFLKSPGDGQPKNLSADLLSADGFLLWDEKKIFLLGLVYGVLAFIILFNFSVYIVTKESIYILFSLQTFFSTLSIAYFDGFLHQYLFPESAYWSNQAIAIVICLTFILNNLFVSIFFNLKVIAPWLLKPFNT